MLWALSYVENFLDNPTWENLQMARTALCTAEAYIDTRKPQEQTATLEEYKILLNSFLISERRSVPYVSSYK